MMKCWNCLGSICLASTTYIASGSSATDHNCSNKSLLVKLPPSGYSHVVILANGSQTESKYGQQQDKWIVLERRSIHHCSTIWIFHPVLPLNMCLCGTCIFLIQSLALNLINSLCSPQTLKLPIKLHSIQKIFGYIGSIDMLSSPEV